MAETITLEGEAAAGLRQAARRAGYDDPGRFVVETFPVTPDERPEPKRGEDGLTRGERFVERLRALKPHLTMTSDDVMEMTRGKDWKSAVPLDEDDADGEQQL
ncbi:MAG: hypothetical protein AAF561_01775 [Planctomycetota bacterium]